MYHIQLYIFSFYLFIWHEFCLIICVHENGYGGIRKPRLYSKAGAGPNRKYFF